MSSLIVPGDYIQSNNQNQIPGAIGRHSLNQNRIHPTIAND
jgi:hypothetical protein